MLFGASAPRGRLPFDLPSIAWRRSRPAAPDVPFDTAEPLFRFGHGLRYRRGTGTDGSDQESGPDEPAA